MTLHRQHLIDPVICIRCNTCEETCPNDAITHDDRNYVVDPAVCKSCKACVSPCPTGAIDNWRLVGRPWTPAEQLTWDEFPEAPPPGDGTGDGAAAEPDEVARLLGIATTATAGRVPPPATAARAYVNLYTRETPAIATVAGNFRITAIDAQSDVRHIVLDFGDQAFPVVEGQNIGVIPPGTDAKGRPHTMRLYSISSPRDGERPNHNNIALTVKRVAGEGARGVCSNFLCDLAKGDKATVTGPFGDSFLMPNHPEANIAMICTGTGSAPFRAFTERRRRHDADASGKMILFFGARTPGELPYFGPLMKLPPSLIDVNLAFSRVAGRPKEYVQDKMRARAATLGELLASENTFIYICGLKGMEKGCEETLAEICRERGLDWKSVRAAMQRQGRYHVETY